MGLQMVIYVSEKIFLMAFPLRNGVKPAHQHPILLFLGGALWRQQQRERKRSVNLECHLMAQETNHTGDEFTRQRPCPLRKTGKCSFSRKKYRIGKANKRTEAPDKSVLSLEVNETYIIAPKRAEHNPGSPGLSFLTF